MTQVQKEAENRQVWQVWVDEKRKIACFHPLDGGRLVEFATRLTYAIFINGLIDESYRFA